MDWFGYHRVAHRASPHPIVEDIKGRVLQELSEMSDEIDIPLTASPFNEIWAEAEFYLDLITSHLNSSKPFLASITGTAEESGRIEFCRAARIGFYLVSADPFHWAHLLIGLSAIARFKLDKIIYIIAGDDARKPGMTPPAIRHAMGRSILNLLSPLFDYSPVALEGDLDGESSLFRILALHQGQRINAFYIAGSDHCRRADPVTGNPDTVHKLEELVRTRACGFDDARHRVSMIFVRRGVSECNVKTRLSVSYLPGMVFEASSSTVRRALAGGESIDKLALLPYTAYLYIRALGLYTTGHRVEQKEGSLSVKRVA